MRFALTVVTAAFFLCGMSATLNDTLIPYLKDVLALSYTEIMCIQLCFYGAYFTVSPLAGAFVARVGYPKAIVTGLLLGGAGALAAYFAAALLYFPLVLGAIFTLGAGVAVLQVSANTYAFLLGPEESAPRRLMTTQAFTCAGMVLAPYLGGFFVGATALFPFERIYLCCSLLWIAIAVSAVGLPTRPTSVAPSPLHGFQELSSSPALRGCFIALACYVGAEVAVGSFLIKFLQDPNIAAMTIEQAARTSCYYWGGIMLGRFVGQWMLRYIDSKKLMTLHAAAGMLLVSLALALEGRAAMLAILALGLCNSIMFPCIFGEGLALAGEHKSQVAGVLCMAQIGGALFPVMQGLLADTLSLHVSFVVPLVCYTVIFTHALGSLRLSDSASSAPSM